MLVYNFIFNLFFLYTIIAIYYTFIETSISKLIKYIIIKNYIKNINFFILLLITPWWSPICSIYISCSNSCNNWWQYCI